MRFLSRWSHIRRTSGFTLIELLVVITILGILLVAIYAPYGHYSRLARVRTSVHLVEQTLSEARILAVQGYILPGTETNADIAVLFESGAQTLDIYAFPHDSQTTALMPSGSGAHVVRTVALEDGVRISELFGSHDRMLLHYDAPHGERTLFSSVLGLPPSPLGFSGASLTI